MTVAVSTVIAILALLGLVVGLVVLGVVIYLLNDILTPLRRALVDLNDAKTAPLLQHGVRGTEQLARTQQLANQVPELAGAYLTKLGLSVDTERRGAIYPDRGPTSYGGYR